MCIKFSQKLLTSICYFMNMNSNLNTLESVAVCRGVEDWTNLENEEIRTDCLFHRIQKVCLSLFKQIQAYEEDLERELSAGIVVSCPTRLIITIQTTKKYCTAMCYWYWKHNINYIRKPSSICKTKN